MDELARRLVIARGDGIRHQKILNDLSDMELLIINDFLTVGIDPEAANDLFAVRQPGAPVADDDRLPVPAGVLP